MPCQYSMTRQDVDTLRFITAPAAGDAAAARLGRSAAYEVAHRTDVEPICHSRLLLYLTSKRSLISKSGPNCPSLTYGPPSFSPVSPRIGFTLSGKASVEMATLTM